MTLLEAGDTSFLSDQEKIAWLRLIRTENVGPVTFYRLIEQFGSADKALEALPSLSRRGGRQKPLQPPPAGAIEKEIEKLHKIGGNIVCAAEEGYPLALGATEDAPPVLSYIGDMSFFRRPSLAIVGARNASLNGRKFAEKLARELGQHGQTIVSGLARGIDTAAHAGSVDTGTVAVLAGGIDVVYPSENQDLYNQIKQYGLVVAESPLGMDPIARHFPKRNRIVSGLSAGVIVIEATLKSGSLITARMAGEQGRDVYAVPGYPADPRAQGPNKLIQDGAVLVQNAMDILQNLNTYSGGKSLQENRQSFMPYAVSSGAELDEQQTENARELILENLSQMPVAVDELVRNCQLTIPAVQSVLLELELAGRLQRLTGNRVMLIDG